MIKLTQIRNLSINGDTSGMDVIPGLLVYSSSHLNAVNPFLKNWSGLYPALVADGLPDTDELALPAPTSAQGIALITKASLFPNLPITGTDTVSIPFKVTSSRHRLSYTSILNGVGNRPYYDASWGGVYGDGDFTVELSPIQFAPYQINNFGRPISYAPLENLSSTNPASNVNDLPLYRTNVERIVGGRRITTSVIRGISSTDVGTRIITRQLSPTFKTLQKKVALGFIPTSASHNAFLISEYELELDNTILQSIKQAGERLYAVWNSTVPTSQVFQTTNDVDGNNIGIMGGNANFPVTSVWNCVAIENLQGGVYRESASSDILPLSVNGVSTDDPVDVENRLSASENTGPYSEIPNLNTY